MTTPLQFERGLQAERTALAWRRTAAALAVASLLEGRVVPDYLGAWALVGSTLGVTMSGVILVIAHRRYRTATRSMALSGARHIPFTGDALPALVAATTLGMGLSAFGVVIAIGLDIT